MSVSEERQKYITNMANGEWVGGLDYTLPMADHEKAFKEQSEIWDKKMEDFLTNCRDPEELHTFVECYNWDSGTEPLLKIAANPACDIKTAMLIFWAGEGLDYTDYESLEEVPSYHTDEWVLIRYVVDRAAAGEYGESVLGREFDTYSPKYEIMGEKWQVPRELFNS